MLRRSILCLVLLLFVQSGNGTLDCPVPIDVSNVANNSSYNIVGRYDEYSDTLTFGSLIERIRSTKSDAFYRDIVNNVIMFLCDVESASKRCVDKESLFAAKDWKGDCIVAADSLCPSGLCERTSNCYWNSVKDMENRTTRFHAADYANAQKALFGASDSYAANIAIKTAIGVIVSVVLLICWFFFFVIRYTCCCLWSSCGRLCFLCSPIPKNRYKTCSDKILPTLIYMITLVGVTAASCIAFLGNEEVSVGLSNAFLHADGLVDDLRSFLQRSRIPLTSINNIIDDAAVDARLIFDGTEYVKDALSIISSFSGFYSLHSSGLNESNALSGFESAVTGFEQKVNPITVKVQSMLDTLELDLYDQADAIKGGIVGALTQLDSFTNKSSDWQDMLYQKEGQEYGFRPTRRAIVMSVFLVSFMFGVFGLVAILLSKSRSCSTFFHMLKMTGIFSALLGSIALILASVLLSATFVFFDSCKSLDIVIEDFEPFVGDSVAPGANACFNDTNLAVAFNVTEKFNFQQKLDEGLSQIKNINITSNFELVLGQLEGIQSLISSVSDSALAALNQATSSNSTICPFVDVYTKANIMEPWKLSRTNDVTPYIIRGNFGNSTSYERSGTEDGGEYLSRIYDKAGVCKIGDSCCVQITPAPPSPCSSNEIDDCDYGINCDYPCEALQVVIAEGHAAFVSLYDKEHRMTADLGVVCPDGATCPTNEFKANYSNLTLVAQVENFETKISSTKDSLVALASTSVGQAMLEVEDFLCNMNVSFVAGRYATIKDHICGKAFFGIEKLVWALFALGMSLEIMAIVSNVLSVRLSGSQKDKYLYDLEGGNGLTRADIY
ncbi:hypothetical protein ACHAXM_012038 [Skeletonema potamos]|jgi:hypothetical protein